MEPVIVQPIIVPRPKSVRDPNRPASSFAAGAGEASAGSGDESAG